MMLETILDFVAPFLKLILDFALGIFFLGVIILMLYFFMFPDKGWKKWRTLNEYWATHPECKTSDGVKCYHCGLRNIRQRGYDQPHDHRRVHYCNQCNAGLYRT